MAQEQFHSQPPPLGDSSDGYESSDGEGPVQIPEEEQWRLVNDSGVLGQAIPIPRRRPKEEEEEGISLEDEIFNAILLIIPFSFLYLLLDILIHHQYAQHVAAKVELGRLITVVPVLSLFIFYTTRYKSTRAMQFVLALMGIICGLRMIWLINHGRYKLVIQQCPPLGVLWIYTVVQLDLIAAVLSLAAVASGVWYLKLKIIF